MAPRPYYDRPRGVEASRTIALILAIIAMMALGFWLRGGIRPSLSHCATPRFAQVTANRMVYDIARHEALGTNQDARNISDDILTFNGLGQHSLVPVGTRVEIPCRG